MKSLLEIVAMRMKKKVIHISTGSTTTTIPYTILLLTLMLTSCMSAISTQKPEATPSATPSEIESGAVYEIPTETQTPALCAVVTAEQALHLRTPPSETSQVKDWLLHGEIVEVISRAGEWMQIKAGPATGYASADYLKESECR